MCGATATSGERSFKIECAPHDQGVTRSNPLPDLYLASIFCAGAYRSKRVSTLMVGGHEYAFTLTDLLHGIHRH